ncbi:hypothetical protein H9P43_001490 [Blastocladiella emersonii ATCC 22665]|nr:hypothetical protein H9P43_001490 [Blastocladiella emersonii ATCC 22665]
METNVGLDPNLMAKLGEAAQRPACDANCPSSRQLLLSAEIGQELLAKYQLACGQLESVRAQHAAAQQQVSSLRIEAEMRSAENRALARDLAAANAQLHSVESSFEALQSMHSLAASASQVNLLRSESKEAALATTVEALEDELQAERSKNHRLLLEAKLHRDLIAQRTRDRDEARTRWMAAEDQVVALKAQNQRLQVDVAKLTDAAAASVSGSAVAADAAQAAEALALLGDLHDAHERLQREHAAVLELLHSTQEELANAQAIVSTSPAADQTEFKPLSFYLPEHDEPPNVAAHARDCHLVIVSDPTLASAHLDADVPLPPSPRSLSPNEPALAPLTTASLLTSSMMVTACHDSNAAPLLSLPSAVSTVGVECQTLDLDDFPPPSPTSPPPPPPASLDAVLHICHSFARQVDDLVDHVHAMRHRVKATDPAALQRHARASSPPPGTPLAPDWDSLCAQSRVLLDAIERELEAETSPSAAAEDASPAPHVGTWSGDSARGASPSRSPRASVDAATLRGRRSEGDTCDSACGSGTGADDIRELLVSGVLDSVSRAMRVLLADAVALQRSVTDASQAYVAMVDAKAAAFHHAAAAAASVPDRVPARTPPATPARGGARTRQGTAATMASSVRSPSGAPGNTSMARFLGLFASPRRPSHASTVVGGGGGT